MKFVSETPTKGRFRIRARNEVYFTGSDKPNERPGMYAFWTALVNDPKPWMRRPHEFTRVPARARVGKPKTERFERMKTDAIIKPNHREFYRKTYRSLKKPLNVRPSTNAEIAFWMQTHPALWLHAKFPEYRKNGVLNPWR
jgi:hypothetical protein